MRGYGSQIRTSRAPEDGAAVEQDDGVCADGLRVGQERLAAQEQKNSAKAIQSRSYAAEVEEESLELIRRSALRTPFSAQCARGLGQNSAGQIQFLAGCLPYWMGMEHQAGVAEVPGRGDVSAAISACLKEACACQSGATRIPLLREERWRCQMGGDRFGDNEGV